MDDKRQKLAEQGKQANAQYVADLSWLMGDARGRRVMAKLFERAGTHRSSFTGNSTTFFNEGARNLGLQFEQDLFGAGLFEQYVTMLKEYQHGRTSNDDRTA